MPALTQARLNTLIDERYRNGSDTFYVGLFLVMPTRSTAGTELTTGGGYTGYARESILMSTTNWSGTQSDGSTSASSGTREYITNNIDIEFVASLAAAWSGIVGWGFFDAASAGNLLEFGAVNDSSGNPITISRAIGERVAFEATKVRLYMR